MADFCSYSILFTPTLELVELMSRSSGASAISSTMSIGRSLTLQGRFLQVKCLRSLPRMEEIETCKAFEHASFLFTIIQKGSPLNSTVV